MRIKLPVIICLSLISIVLKGQDPVITMTTSKSAGTEISFVLSSSSSITVQVDFGNGVKINKSIGTARTTITGTVGVSKTVKIYGSGIGLLDCISCQLTALDVSGCPNLVTLQCSNNQLTALDVSMITSLYNFYCGNNLLTSIDLSLNSGLYRLDCGTNQITNLDVTRNTSLISLSCQTNKIAALDISKNLALESLSCHSNLLTSLDVSKNSALTYINCHSNGLTSLDITHNTALQNLWCYYNQFTFATLPSGVFTMYTYEPQNWMPISKNVLTGAEIDLSSQYSIQGNYTVYTWKKTNGTALIENKDYTLASGKTVFIKAQPDSVYCEMTNAAFPNLSGDKALRTVNMKVKRSQMITFNPIPEKNTNDPAFDLSASSTSGLPITFTSSDPLIASVEGNTATIHQQGSVTFTASQAGNDTLTSAKATQVLTIIFVTSVKDNEAEAQASAYPNPVNDVLFIKGIEGKSEASIFTLSGSMIWSGVIGNSLYVSELRPGVYMLRLKTEGQKEIILKFTKQ